MLMKSCKTGTVNKMSKIRNRFLIEENKKEPI